MDPQSLPRVGPIINASKDIIGLFRPYFSIAGKKVLCIGYSEAELVELIEPYGPAEIVCLTNWADHADAQVRRHKLVVGDLCGRTCFGDGAFDAVIQLSVQEHLHDVEAAFVETRRLLRRGGHAAILFGPAWSCACGHHLYIDADDPLLNFVQWKIPAHAHLLCDKDELRDWYRRAGYTDPVIDKVVHWFFEAPIINRVFYDDYVQLMARFFQLVACEVMYQELPPEHLALLRQKFPSRLDFSSYGGKYLLRA